MYKLNCSHKLSSVLLLEFFSLSICYGFLSEITHLYSFTGVFPRNQVTWPNTAFLLVEIVRLWSEPEFLWLRGLETLCIRLIKINIRWPTYPFIYPLTHDLVLTNCIQMQPCFMHIVIMFCNCKIKLLYIWTYSFAVCCPSSYMI